MAFNYTLGVCCCIAWAWKTRVKHVTFVQLINTYKNIPKRVIEQFSDCVDLATTEVSPNQHLWVDYNLYFENLSGQ